MKGCLQCPDKLMTRATKSINASACVQENKAGVIITPLKALVNGQSSHSNVRMSTNESE